MTGAAAGVAGRVAFTPEGVAETLQTLYFEFVRLIPRMHEEITVEAPELCEHLYVLERLYRAINAMEEAEFRRGDRGGDWALVRCPAP